MNYLSYKFKINNNSMGLFLLIITSIIASYLFLTLINYKCIFHELFHIWCPGCGGTRMIISIFNLDFYQAFRWNPLLFILFILGIIYIIIGIIIYIKKRVIMIPNIKVCIFILCLLLFYMIIRNIDMFSYLIPTRIS